MRHRVEAAHNLELFGNLGDYSYFIADVAHHNAEDYLWRRQTRMKGASL